MTDAHPPLLAQLDDPAWVEHALLRARSAVESWLFRERGVYADQKWNVERRVDGIRSLLNDPHQENDVYWTNFIFNYYKRAQQYGLNTPQGKQALGKALVTMHAMLEAATIAHGKMPLPGYPSGEIH